jgi:hypothetical protein
MGLIMRNRVIDAIATRNRIVGAAIGASKVAGKATAKGQRSALAKVGKSQSVGIEKEVWSAPVGFAIFCEAENLPFTSVVEALQVAQNGTNAEALVAQYAIKAHSAYRAERFDEAFTINDVPRLVKREQAYQRAGGIELGLGGYSADDVIQIAIVRSWNDAVVRFLVATGQLEREEAEVIRQALNKRSLIDFADARDASDVVLYDIRERDGYVSIIKRDVSKMVQRVARQGSAFYQVAGMLTEQAERLEFTIGEVYRNIIKVRRDGVAAIRKMLEGYTPDGTFTASIEFTAGERNSYEFRSAVNNNLEASLLVASAESDFISRHFSVQDERQELIEALLASDLVPAEAEAAAFISLLNNGFSIAELKEEVFADLSSRRFNSMVKTAQELIK